MMKTEKKINDFLYELDEIVCETFGVEHGFMNMNTRREPYPMARFSVFWALNQLGFCPAEIARKTDFSYSSVIHGIEKFSDTVACEDDRCRVIKRWMQNLPRES